MRVKRVPWTLSDLSEFKRSELSDSLKSQAKIKPKRVLSEFSLSFKRRSELKRGELSDSLKTLSDKRSEAS